ncbi:MAG: DUF5654 family protein [Candidatus Pacearchaeota archaeon]|jgi:hypothetical protein|nr:hypothetical protein [Candidatus Pacearchaeota archaeon]MDP7520834.1 DUF5654 family protein [Candidatus Pacearchaeota archaeon]|tara:strand:- start:868 stop:1149 length:282 start_codon:yes stop_codon:yes gene_type:complete
MRDKLYNFFIGGKRFEKEFKKQVRLLIVLTLGFTIAFTWRQTLFDVSQALVQLIIDVKGSTSLSILTSTFITIVSIIIIYLTSHFLKENKENY